MNVMPARDERVRIAAPDTAADYLLARGSPGAGRLVEPGDVETYVAAADLLRMRFNLALYADPGTSTPRSGISPSPGGGSRRRVRRR